MERNPTSFKNGIESNRASATQAICRCDTCGKEFETPLLAMISSGSKLEEYCACPKCLSKVGNLEPQENLEVDEAVENETLKTKIEGTAEESPACAHHFGYLKHRPKNMPIPEECFICSKMIECMSQ
jgi:DNA-directed RNA polymerase subunit RPC12/RpoP